MKRWRTKKPLAARLGGSTTWLSIEAGVELDEIPAGTDSPEETRVAPQGSLESYIVKISELGDSAQLLP
jgi:hypothetical protein